MVSRRKLMSIVLVGGSTSLAGCGQYLGSGSSDGSSGPEKADRETKATNTQLSEQLKKQAEKSKSYRRSIPVNWPSEEIFSYGSFDRNDLDLWLTSRIVAETGEDGMGDRLLILPNQMGAEETATALRSQWGVPVENMISTSIDGKEVSLSGGEGISIWGFVGQTSLNGSKWIVAARGVDEDSAQGMAESIAIDMIQ